MSEEEIEAIHDLADIRFEERINKKIDIVLNLTDRLQRQNREYEYTITGMVQTRDDNFIPKYKIKDKIKELAKQHDIEKDMYKRFDIEAQIEVLEELLGE